MKKRWVLVFLLGVEAGAFALTAESSAEHIRAETAEYIRRKNQQEGIRAFTAYLSGELEAHVSLNSCELKTLAGAADAVRLMKLTEIAPLADGSLAWILASDERLRLLVETILPVDDLKPSFKILQELWEHDPAGRDEYFELIMALSVVWDRPRRPLLHGQMGMEPLHYLPEIVRRYDYFKALYSGGEAKMPYSKLGVGELLFVVETPVPLEELEWARQHEEGTRDAWGKKYDSIEYDHGRLDAMQYNWPHGPYTLQAIKEKGGICVDQAYYAAITARAFGIPAIYFHAIGEGGGHAWFSFMKAPGTWDLDVGRYSNKGYTTGLAINPQTNRRMTDHDVKYACERSLRSDEFEKANEYISIAYALQGEVEPVRRCAKAARELVENYLPAWTLEMDALLASGDLWDAFGLFEDQRKVFKDYPDVVVASAARIEIALRAAGEDDKANELRRMVSRSVGDERDDLDRFIGVEKVKNIASSGDIKRARREMEGLMEDHVKDGIKAFELIQMYLNLTKDTDQVKAATRFLEEYVKEIQRVANFSSSYEKNLLGYLARAYENSGDHKKQAATELRKNALE